MTLHLSSEKVACTVPQSVRNIAQAPRLAVLGMATTPTLVVGSFLMVELSWLAGSLEEAGLRLYLRNCLWAAMGKSCLTQGLGESHSGSLIFQLVFSSVGRRVSA